MPDAAALADLTRAAGIGRAPLGMIMEVTVPEA
jgi:hypothetical protein